MEEDFFSERKVSAVNSAAEMLVCKFEKEDKGHVSRFQVNGIRRF